MPIEYYNKWYSTVIHIRTCIKNWVKYYIEDEETAERIATEYIYKQFYDYSNSPYLWSYDRFISWYNGKGEERKCEYCGLSEDDSKAFYDHVQSYRYQRGKTLEVDRRVCYMRDYKTDEDFGDVFFADFMEFAKDKESEIRRILLPAIEEKIFELDGETTLKDELLFLPAPYNPENCVLACYWCNNAKTDAFTDKEFGPIGEVIGKTIKSVINDQGNAE